MIAIKVENLSKQYRLGEVGTGTISHDLNRWWHRVRGKEDPYLKIGESNDRSTKGNSEYVWALQDINFEVQQGEVLGIIGKNGAGKSTLLKILSKVTGPTTGAIKAKGRIASLLEVGTGFHPELTGRENIYLNGTILGMTRAEVSRKLDEIVDFAGVERYLDTPVKRYSSGMMVRLGFAVAAHLEPEILIVDEVLAVGDAEFQKKAIGKMQEVSQGQGRTVLFVSHNMESIRQLCTNCVLLDNGYVDSIGETIEIIRSYSKPIVNNLSSIINLLNKTINGNDFEIINLQISNKNGMPSEVFSNKEDFFFKLKVFSNQGYSERIRFILRFISPLGSHVLVVGQQFESLSNGASTISVQIPLLNINNQHLILCLAIDSPGFKVFLNYTNIYQFFVSKPRQGLEYSHEHFDDILSPNSFWTIT